MRGYNPPPLAWNTGHDLRFPANQAAIQPFKFQIRGGKIATETGDAYLALCARRIGFYASPEGPDRFNPVEKLRDPVSHHARVIPEADIQHGGIIAGDRSLIPVKYSTDFRDDVGIVDFHGAFPVMLSAIMAQNSARGQHGDSGNENGGPQAAIP
jgi:hypothetical protein